MSADAGPHALLLRQLRKCGGDLDAPPRGDDWRRFIERIDAHYRSLDEDRYLLERTMAISSDEMRALHAQVSAERAQLQHVLTALPQGVLVIDADGTVIAANDAARRLTGREDVDGAHVDTLLWSIGGVQRPLADALASREGLSVGTGAGATPIQLARATLDGGRWLLSLTDVSDRLAAEAALHEARVDALAARRAEAARASFLANMSHELRTPLNAILGYAEMLCDELPSHREDLERIHHAGAHLLGLINDVLDLSKIDAERMEIAYTHFDVGALVAEVADDLRAVVEANHNRLESEAPPGVMVRLDRTKLKQCLYNLVANAARYTDAGVVRLSVEVDVHELRLAVADDGVGIDPDELPRLFEPFAQARNKRGGTGLGLTLVRAMAEGMGGRCAARSAPGLGSTFTLRFPIAVVGGSLADG